MLIAALLVLVLLAVLTDLGETRPAVLALAVVVAAWLGTTLPDLDLSLGLGHRSGLTHSVLPVAACAWRQRWRAVAAGLALGIALHLAADCFPNAMRGFALVKLPGVGALDAGESYGWLFANAVLAMAIGGWLVVGTHPPRQAVAVIAAVGVVGLGYLFKTDGGWWVLALVGVSGGAMTYLRATRFTPPLQGEGDHRAPARWWRGVPPHDR